MHKTIGVLALLGSAVGTVIGSTSAFAQDGYYRHPDDYYYADRNGDRHQWRNWYERERHERRAEEWRERRWREHEWREHAWREHERRERC
jgi:hypothetical protein